MANITLVRSNELMNRFRHILIFLNGQRLCELSNGETRSFELKPGTHTLQAKIDWCSSQPFSFQIGDTEHKTFLVSSFAKHHPLGIFAASYFMLLKPDKYMRWEEIGTASTG
jgi:hypothetical protein